MLSADCDLLEDELLEAGLLPAVIGRALHGRQPTEEQIRILCDALSRLPVIFRRAILRRGQRIEAVHGKNARNHPRFNHIVTKSLGVANEKLAVVATDSQTASMIKILYHETGHLLSLGYPGLNLSESRLWKKIWQNDLTSGVVPSTNDQQKLSEEYFAECFSKYYYSAASRINLSPAVKQYMGKLPSLFCGCPS